MKRFSLVLASLAILLLAAACGGESAGTAKATPSRVPLQFENLVNDGTAVPPAQGNYAPTVDIKAVTPTLEPTEKPTPQEAVSCWLDQTAQTVLINQEVASHVIVRVSNPSNDMHNPRYLKNFVVEFKIGSNLRRQVLPGNELRISPDPEYVNVFLCGDSGAAADFAAQVSQP